MQYGISVKQVTHPSTPLYKTAIYGGLRGGNIGWNIDLDDKQDKDKYFIGGTYQYGQGSFGTKIITGTADQQSRPGPPMKITWFNWTVMGLSLQISP